MGVGGKPEMLVASTAAWMVAWMAALSVDEKVALSAGGTVCGMAAKMDV